jgi:hypothetical protein
MNDLRARIDDAEVERARGMGTVADSVLAVEAKVAALGTDVRRSAAESKALQHEESAALRKEMRQCAGGTTDAVQDGSAAVCKAVASSSQTSGINSDAQFSKLSNVVNSLSEDVQNLLKASGKNFTYVPPPPPEPSAAVVVMAAAPINRMELPCASLVYGASSRHLTDMLQVAADADARKAAFAATALQAVVARGAAAALAEAERTATRRSIATVAAGPAAAAVAPKPPVAVAATQTTEVHTRARGTETEVPAITVAAAQTNVIATNVEPIPSIWAAPSAKPSVVQKDASANAAVRTPTAADAAASTDTPPNVVSPTPASSLKSGAASLMSQAGDRPETPASPATSDMDVTVSSEQSTPRDQPLKVDKRLVTPAKAAPAAAAVPVANVAARSAVASTAAAPTSAKAAAKTNRSASPSMSFSSDTDDIENTSFALSPGSRPAGIDAPSSVDGRSPQAMLPEPVHTGVSSSDFVLEASISAQFAPASMDASFGERPSMAELLKPRSDFDTGSPLTKTPKSGSTPRSRSVVSFVSGGDAPSSRPATSVSPGRGAAPVAKIVDPPAAFATPATRAKLPAVGASPAVATPAAGKKKLASLPFATTVASSGAKPTGMKAFFNKGASPAVLGTPAPKPAPLALAVTPAAAAAAARTPAAPAKHGFDDFDD